jgi:predicted metal-dependent hydrolase
MKRREVVSRDLLRLPLGDGHVDYVLVRRRGRRGVGLKVDGHGLTVSAPSSWPLARIESIARESEPWIVKKVAEWSARRVPEISWTEGARLPYLGGGLELQLARGSRAMAAALPGVLRVMTRDGSGESIRRAVVAWYKRAARDVLVPRVMELSARAGIAPPRVSISSAMARWGSCNSHREVRLAWRLVKAPRELVDYVICHELAHLRHMNHSAAFWAEVERQLPGHAALRKRLFATDHLYRSF